MTPTTELFILLLACLMDTLWGDPSWLPHPVVYFGNTISFLEKRFNGGSFLLLRGALMAIGLVLVVALFFIGLMKLVDFIHPSLTIAVSVLFLFFGLANRTLIVEGRMVFEVLDKQGLDAGRKQLARIVRNNFV